MIGLPVLSAGIAAFFSMPFAFLLQGAGYHVETMLKRGGKFILRSVLWFVAVSPVSIFSDLLFGKNVRLIAYFSVCCLTFGYLVILFKKMKMTGRFTKRLVRLSITHFLLYSILFFPLYFTSFRSLWGVSPSLSPLTLCLANFVLLPFEKKNNDRYVKRAKETIRKMNAIKIGITGSYGKTSVKNALKTFLSVSYDTLSTPANYNTPLGIAKTLDEATGKEEVLIVEMGARRVGDIQELCEMVMPDLGILTGIAPQHLETFGSIDAILSEKNELAQFVPKQGCVFYNVSDAFVRSLAEKREGKKITIGYEDADCLIRNLCISSEGTRFELICGQETISFETPLIGKGAAEDLALAAAVALYLGIPSEKVVSEAKTMKPAPHRLELIKQNGLLILDDSYNVNPIGVEAALDALKEIKGDRKIVYTSGLVELGESEATCNEWLGKKIATVADLAIVSKGRLGDQIVKGLKMSDFSEEMISRTNDTSEASILFSKLLQKGDVLLITSDLPREYRL